MDAEIWGIRDYDSDDEEYDEPDDEGADEPDDELSPPEQRGRSGFWLGVVGLIVLLAIGAGVWLLAGDDDGGNDVSAAGVDVSPDTDVVDLGAPLEPDPGPEAAAPDLPVAGIGIVDSFNRPDGDGGLGESDNGRNWGNVGGTWGIRNGHAALIELGQFRGITVAEMGGSDGTIRVTSVRPQPKTGLVFRYVDASNYWMLLAVPSVETWNLKKVVDNEVIDVTNLGEVNFTAGAVLAVELLGRDISVFVDGDLAASVVDATHIDGRRVGLSATGGQATSARWDDLVAIPRVGDLPDFEQLGEFELDAAIETDE